MERKRLMSKDVEHWSYHEERWRLEGDGGVLIDREGIFIPGGRAYGLSLTLPKLQEAVKIMGFGCGRPSFEMPTVGQIENYLKGNKAFEALTSQPDSWRHNETNARIFLGWGVAESLQAEIIHIARLVQIDEWKLAESMRKL